jgi:transcriptional regulator with XRE-family HTH domain
MNEDNILRLFGLHVKKVRQKHGLSQEELAHISELDRTYISGIERGKRNVSLINIVKIAISLNTTPSDLLAVDWEEST